MAPKKRKLAGAKARARRTIERDVLPESGLLPAGGASGEACGACLLPIQPDSQIGRIDNCQHVFHYECVQRWSQTENTCPQCKIRFYWLAAYTTKGARKSLQQVERRDQEADDDDGYEDVQVCERCKEVGDESTLLLCDGMHGTCNAAYHQACVGLSSIPRGSWFCPDCIERGFDTDSAGRRGRRAPPEPGPESQRADSAASAPRVPAPMQEQPRDAEQQAAPASDRHGQDPAAVPPSLRAAGTPAAEVPAVSSTEAASASAPSAGRGGRGRSALPPQLRLSALACVTAPVPVPAFRGGGAGAEEHAGGERNIFASFVHRRRQQREGREPLAGTGFISLNPTYEDDFMGKKTEGG